MRNGVVHLLLILRPNWGNPNVPIFLYGLRFNMFDTEPKTGEILKILCFVGGVLFQRPMTLTL